LKIMKKYDSDISKANAEERAIFDKADGKPEYEKCVAISTKASLREMMAPGILAIATPVAFGFIGGAEMLGGLLAGVTVSGVLLAIFQSNAGGAWDNAKKMVEEGFEHEGQVYKKGSEAHKATVVGDTVGDPFKDTSGPSLNILIKLMSVVALVIAPSIAMDINNPSESDLLNNLPSKEIILEEKTVDGKTIINEKIITSTIDENGIIMKDTAVTKTVIDNIESESDKSLI